MEIGRPIGWMTLIARRLARAGSRGVSAAGRPVGWLRRHRSEFMAVATLTLMLAPLLL